MAHPRQTPIVIGVGDYVNRSKKIEDALEPLELISRAIRLAVEDTGLSEDAIKALQSSIDSLEIVRSWTWPYPDLPSLVAKKLNIKPTRRYYSDHGGNTPGKLFDGAARRISLGETKVALLSGGEALASLSTCAAAKKLPPPGWTKLDEDVTSVFSPTTRQLKPGALPGAWKPPREETSNIAEDLGATHDIGNPIQVYPLYENALRAHRNQSIAENHAESVAMYKEFADVAENHAYAWTSGQHFEEADIGAISKKNRMICFPYPLLMNAFNTINLAGAVILTSTDYARELGIPESKWIYALGGAGTRDSNDFWERPSFWWSPCISRSLDAGLEASGLEKEDIDLYDFYSCFPIVPKLACRHLGLPSSKGAKPITLLGGLTSFGGAGNNYSMHAITEMTRQLRQGKGKNGLILANGGVATYQAVVCLSRSPRHDGLPYPNSNPLPDMITDVQSPAIDVKAEGDATVETYTVEFNRDGSPLRGYVVGRLKKNGHRFVSNHADESTLKQLCNWEVEPIGRNGKVRNAEVATRHNGTLRPAAAANDTNSGPALQPQTLRPDPKDCLSTLPRVVIIELLEYYIDYIHDKPHSLFHCPSLRRDVETGVADVALLCSILALSARFSASEDTRSKGPQLAQEAQALLTADFEHASLSKIQAWVILGNVCGARHDYVTESLFFGLAIRTAYITGLTTPHEDDNAVMREIRSRVWWTLFMLDRWSSAGLGLPRQIADQQIPQQLPRSEIVFHQLSTDEELWPGEGDDLGLWAHMITLVRHFGPIQDLNRLLAADGASQVHIDLTVSRVAHELESWQTSLPEKVRLSADSLHWHKSHGQGRTLVALHMGYYHYATLLFFQYLDRAASSLSHASTYAERCREHASGFSDLLRTSHEIAGCEAVYNIVGQMTIVSSSVLIHTLLFGNEEQVAPAKIRLESNFKILMKLKQWWPSVATMTSKLFRFQQACLESADERTHKVDRWMIKFLLEHANSLGEKTQDPSQDTSPRSAADLDAAHWLSERNKITRQALSHLQR